MKLTIQSPNGNKYVAVKNKYCFALTCNKKDRGEYYSFVGLCDRIKEDLSRESGKAVKTFTAQISL